MLSCTLKPLRTVIVGLGLFAGMASAQAQLLMTFREDSASGHLSIVFSGRTTANFDVQVVADGKSARFLDKYAYTYEERGPDESSYSFPLDMTYVDQLPVTKGYGTAISNSGTGGFAYLDNNLMVFATMAAPAGSPIIWDGISTYVGDLEDIGLEEGDFGTLVFSNGTDTFTIDWNTATVVPEPATYALVLGLGIAGVALLRRR